MKTTTQIIPQDYPELAALVWNGDPSRPLDPKEALAIYERNWRFVEPSRLGEQERALIAELVATVGNGHLLV
ncbi:MAG TPA: hypothetical protein VNX29_18130 [Kaistia sp.]|nr:hypothetical protein [Kaistia sp.]